MPFKYLQRSDAVPLISIPLSDVTVATSSVFLGVAVSAIGAALDLRVVFSIGLGVAIGLISYTIGVIPIGLYVAFGLVAAGAISRRVFSGKSSKVATNQPIEKRKFDFVSLIFVTGCVFVVFLITGSILSVSNKMNNTSLNNESQSDYLTLPAGYTSNPYDLLEKTTNNKLFEADGYRFGASGTQKNYSKATELYYALIADAQSTKGVQDLAALRLAEMIYDGVGFAKNPKQSIEWYEFLIRRNAPYSLPAYRLGYIYENGEGVPQNVVYAYCYYNLSASSKELTFLTGLPDHLSTGKRSSEIQVAREVSRYRREQLEKLMTVDQVRQAQGLKRCGLAP